MTWLDVQLSPLAAEPSRPAIVLDPDGVIERVTPPQLADAEIAWDWFGLRKVYERSVRHTPVARPIIVVRDAQIREPRDLSWDVEQHCLVVLLRWPVERAWRSVLTAVDEGRSDRLVEAVGRSSGSSATSAVLRDVFGVSLPASDLASELDAVARLRLSPSTPAGLWPHVQPLVKGELSCAVAHQPPDFSIIQDAWRDWLARGSDSPHAEVLAQASPAMTAFIASGLVQPEPLVAVGLPHWSKIGVASAGDSARVDALLAELPSAWPPDSFDDWVAAATWWGEVRAALSGASDVSSELAEAAEARWCELDERFGPWLMENLGVLMTRQGERPFTVNQIASFLNTRLLEGAKPMVLVLDGMALSQWVTIRRAARFRVVESHAAFALCPTLTSVSRQAIFAGDWPAGFADSVWTTEKEQRRWQSFWHDHGLSEAQVAYARTEGITASDVVVPSTARVVGLVVTAVDKLLHGTTSLGDVQLSASTKLWVQHGAIDQIIEEACEKGLEVWITSDHGNVVTSPLGRKSEGVRTEQAGLRVRVYENSALRDGSRAEGIAWDPPGMPSGQRSFLFAPGRGAYHSESLKICHGGISIDEVVVPFARVEAS